MLKRLLLFTLLLCSISLAQDELYSISDEDFAEAIADGKLTLTEFGMSGATKYWDGETYLGPFNLIMPSKLAEYVDLSLPVRLVADPPQFRMRFNGQDAYVLDTFENKCAILSDSFASDLLKLNEVNTIEYTKCGSGNFAFSPETYFEFQPVLKIEPQVPGKIFIDNPIPIAVKVTNIGRIAATDLSLEASSGYADVEAGTQNLELGESYTFKITFTPAIAGELNFGTVTTSTGASAELGIHTVVDPTAIVEEPKPDEPEPEPELIEEPEPVEEEKEPEPVVAEPQAPQSNLLLYAGIGIVAILAFLFFVKR